MEIPKEFFTAESMFTLTGASAVTVIICNSLQKALNFNPKWLALAIAETLTIVGTFASQASAAGSWGVSLLIAVVNGFLVYATATGGAQIAGAARPVPGKKAHNLQAPAPSKGNRREFATPWF
jgi:hypothetical protein